MTAFPDDSIALESDRLRLQPLRPGDEARLRAVFEAARDYFAAIGAGAPTPEAAAVRELAGCADTAGRAVAVLSLLETGEDAGAIGWWSGSPEPGVALLGMLMVAPAQRGRGLAREALDTLEVWLAGTGVRALRTAFPYRRQELHPLARALGFREMSIAEHAQLGLAGVGTSLWEKPIGGG